MTNSPHLSRVYQISVSTARRPGRRAGECHSVGDDSTPRALLRGAEHLSPGFSRRDVGGMAGESEFNICIERVKLF